MRRENSELQLSQIEESILEKQFWRFPELTVEKIPEILQQPSSSSSSTERKNYNDIGSHHDDVLVHRDENRKSEEDIIDENSTLELMPSWFADELSLTPLQRRHYFELLQRTQR